MRWIIAMCLLLCVTAVAKEEQRKCKMGRDYWLYTPETMDKNKTYWLVVGVHGFRGNGKGAAGLAGWATKMDNVIVVGPTFPSTGPYYQVLGGNSDKQLLDLHKELSKEFKLHGKMFLHGFSGGSQFASRFASKYYKNVIGVSSHSGGSWEAGPSKGSESVLWTLSCGLKDTKLSMPDSKYSRIDFFRNYYAAMNKGKYTAKPFVTQSGHGQTKEVKANAEECFRVSTTGMFDYQRKATAGMTPQQRDAFIYKDKTLQQTEFDDGTKKYNLMTNQDGWTVGPAALAEMTKTRKMLDRLPK